MPDLAPADHSAPSRRRRLGTAGLNVLRGGVIGAVEVVPGVSGGTLALVVGVYETLIASAGELVRGAVAGATAPLRRTGMDRSRAHFARVRWGVLVPLGLGMLTAIVLVSATLAPLIEDHPVQTRALFAGLIVASLIVPARMVGRWRAREVLVAVVGAVAAFWLTGLTGVERADPSLWLVLGAASLAVCALVLPGVSGSFLLLVLGMYASTLAAVNDRDLAYLGVFAAGAVMGLAVFVTGLQWMLAHHHALTLATMTGLMLGSLRALWPWQGDDASLQAPAGDLLPVIVLFVVGIAAVGALLVLEHVASRRTDAALQTTGATADR
ncbi:DUF368 domain-containing protein [Demequina aestuarii]|uniref:DUF368 domain-containing protein n=1 Tax=Demequina aestuarii TaxID=327095 RepID=UPI0009FDB384|nr:DUF368 domain-containing protein [Demequina aestuarii]